MWLEAVHLLISVHHVYTVCYLLSIDYTGVTDKYLINMKDMGFRFLTIWNMVLQITYYIACTVEHFLSAKVGDSQPLLKKWQKLREVAFQALVFPMGLIISSSFWVLCSYDRSLVWPEFLDRYVPSYVNHMMHTNVSVVVVLEMLLYPHHYHHRGRNLGIILVFCCNYLFCYYYTYWTRGVWMYPLYDHLNLAQQLLMTALFTFVLPSACYLLGEKLANVIWGKGISQTKEEKKRF